MKEAARVLTVAPVVIQLASEDDEVSGYKWRAGTPIGVNYGVIHKHTAYWKDPEKRLGLSGFWTNVRMK